MSNKVETDFTVDLSQSPPNGSIITFRSVNYHIDVQDTCNACTCPCLKKTPKPILNNVSGIFRPGMNAIMGPSGSGKSSLLDILADRKDRNGLEGEILLDGRPQDEDYKYRVGYVVQDDIVSGNLTVKENLMFSANVRLSPKTPVEEKEKIVSEVISQLGLLKCADSMVGTEFRRGVSGGERKRTNIGMELVLSPNVLFLDEPTTGLDSSTARNVMECMYELSRKGRTIIFSIHQPRYSIFSLFDTLYLVAAGYTIYHGPAAGVLDFFSSIGYPCEEHNNPADFILDVCQGERTSMESKTTKSSDGPVDAKALAISFNQSYLNTPTYKTIENDVNERARSPKPKNELEKKREKSRYHDMLYVAQRTLRNAFRDPSLSILQTVIATILAILVGLIYLNLSNTLSTGVKNRNGALFFIVTNQVFSNLSALDLFIRERALFVHENISGYYHTLTYFLAKIFCDMIPLRTIPAILFSIIVYFMMGLQRTAAKFFIFFFCVWLTSICSTALCFFVSASVDNTAVGNLLAALFCVLTLIFSGFLVDINSVVAFLRWIQYFSIFRYSTNALMINEYTGLTLCYANDTSVCPTSGSDYLTTYGIDNGSDWDLWKNFFAIGCIALGLLVLAYIQLRRIKKTK